MDFEMMSKADAVAELSLWIDKGYGALEAFRVLKDGSGGLIVGIASYTDPDEIRIPEHLNRAYRTYKDLFGAFGALVDAVG